MRNSKIIMFLAVTVVIIGWLVFWIAKKQLTWSAAISQSTGSVSGAQIVAQPQHTVTQVLSDPPISPVASFDNNSIWYFNSAGKLFEINSDGSNLSEFPLPPESFSIKRI